MLKPPKPPPPPPQEKYTKSTHNKSFKKEEKDKTKNKKKEMEVVNAFLGLEKTRVTKAEREVKEKKGENTLNRKQRIPKNNTDFFNKTKGM